ncbi:MAG: RNA-binding S4 domain-containing protein [Candidatus Fimenecus sp.]
MKPIKITAKVVPKPKKQVQITTDFIRLDAALKLADAVQTGGHAKIVITEGEIKVNGEICTQRGRKLRKGDSFSFENTVYEIV